MKAVDIPQADSLSRIRELVQTVQFGASDTARLQKVMSLHPRHVGYHLHAARVLGWLVRDDEQWQVTELGAGLVATGPGSQEERAVYRDSIKAVWFSFAIFSSSFCIIIGSWGVGIRLSDETESDFLCFFIAKCLLGFEILEP